MHGVGCGERQFSDGVEEDRGHATQGIEPGFGLFGATEVGVPEMSDECSLEGRGQLRVRREPQHGH